MKDLSVKGNIKFQEKRDKDIIFKKLNKNIRIIKYTALNKINWRGRTKDPLLTKGPKLREWANQRQMKKIFNLQERVKQRSVTHGMIRLSEHTYTVTGIHKQDKPKEIYEETKQCLKLF